VLGQDFQRAAKDHLAGDGQHAAMADPIQERHADLVLQLLDRLAHRRLGSEHHLRGL
jgi:hypothetical protein